MQLISHLGFNVQSSDVKRPFHAPVDTSLGKGNIVKAAQASPGSVTERYLVSQSGRGVASMPTLHTYLCQAAWQRAKQAFGHPSNPIIMYRYLPIPG